MRLRVFQLSKSFVGQLVCKQNNCISTNATRRQLAPILTAQRRNALLLAPPINEQLLATQCRHLTTSHTLASKANQNSSSSSSASGGGGGGGNQDDQKPTGWFNSMMTGTGRDRASRQRSAPRDSNNNKQRRPTSSRPTGQQKQRSSSSSNDKPLRKSSSNDDSSRGQRNKRQPSNSRRGPNSSGAPSGKSNKAPKADSTNRTKSIGQGQSSPTRRQQTRSSLNQPTDSVKQDKGAHKFVLDLGNGQSARIDYRPVEGTKRIELYHTEVPEELRGRGIGRALAEGAFECASKANLRLLVTCDYLLDYLDRFADDKHRKLTEDN